MKGKSMFLKKNIFKRIQFCLSKMKKHYYHGVGILYKKFRISKIRDQIILKADRSKSDTEFKIDLRKREFPIFLPVKKSDRFIEFIESNFPDSKVSLVNAGNRASEHIFDLLGSGEKFYGQNIDWHLDIKTNWRWPLRHFKSYDAQELDCPSDIKMPWELSRCQHFITLGQAYWLTGNEKYAEAYKTQIESWISDNPLSFGINWLSTMEVSLRACNWITAWHFFKESPSIDDEFTLKFARSLIQHGKHIFKHLENRGAFTSNHYLSNLAGLLYLGFFFQNLEEGKYWKTFAIKELKSEMQKQVNSDGMNFEGSTCYHRLALELFLFSTLVVAFNEDPYEENYRAVSERLFGNDFVTRLYKMFEFILYTIKPNGMMPQIGDNDDGRFLVFSIKNILDIRYLLNLGATFFNEPIFKIKEFGLAEDSLWLFGKKAYDQWAQLSEKSVSDLKSHSFVSSGIYIMRNRNTYVAISCMQNGQNGNGGHNHNDVMSFELNINGTDYIIDPGTYSYSGDYKMRNLFRSSFSHNTLIIDRKEINDFNEKEIFRMENEAKPRVISWVITEDCDQLEAEHYGFKKLIRPVTHRRRFTFDKRIPALRIDDFLEGQGSYFCEFNYHFPALHLQQEGEVIRLTASQNSIISMTMTVQAKQKIQVEIKEGWISPSYGIKVKAPLVTCSNEFSLPISFTTVINLLHENLI